ncbi:proteasome ATPase [Micropruina sonneratiae]|uniref:proteasome ATPase n=1 Tax=Micropruina sonneratiae TaxID=2986940 RepID=UPI0022267CCE|nr:proteasome ATPase [Micropruina sp. KQZ13P-5]MCW3157703.1 proteasome ATPase [Micropruina sp. KQZ13P-5]
MTPPLDELAQARALAEARGRAAELAERRLADARADTRSLAQQNEKLNATLREARETLLSLRAQLEALANPPQAHGLVVGEPGAGLADVTVGGRVLRVALGPEVDAGAVPIGTPVLLNEAMMLVGLAPAPAQQELVVVSDVLADGRLLVTGSAGEESLLVAAPALTGIKAGQTVAADRRAGVALSVVERTEVNDLLLDEVPDVDYADIGGLARQIEQIRDAVELPFLHRDLYARYQLPAPKGVLLYGPPGCGKTMIAKAVANSLGAQLGGVGSHFLNIKGPELLNKYVGETERQIRVIFATAREHAADGRPVIVFFDEMDSLFRTRGSGVSSDMESTVVPQLLSEIDGVESLSNVIIIGATNREDLIDPAILRPGRLDVKIKLDRPDAAAAAEILAKYLTATVPMALGASGGDPDGTRRALIDATVDQLYRRSDTNRFLEVTYASGDREVLYVSDFVSGAMLANVVGRAKKAAIKDVLAGRPDGLLLDHLLQACADEVAENEDLPNTTNPDDWARISGRKGERITFMRTLRGGRQVQP